MVFSHASVGVPLQQFHPATPPGSHSLQVTNEQTKQILLTYFLLWRHGPQTITELEQGVDVFLQEEFNAKSNIDIEDAVEKLFRLGFATDCEGPPWASEKIAAVGPPRDILHRFSGINDRLMKTFHDFQMQSSPTPSPPPS